MDTLSTRVRKEWTDYNGHLRDANFLLLFSLATDALMDRLGLDEAGRAQTGHTLFTLEVHLNYLAEVKAGEQVAVHTLLLAHDHKRLHIYHTLRRGDVDVAVSEQMLMNVSTEAGRSTNFDAGVLREIEGWKVRQGTVDKPAYTGRVIGLPR
ncbi:thioesterase family protein [Pseudomonas sp. Marseille-QA0892]